MNRPNTQDPLLDQLLQVVERIALSGDL